MKRVLFIPLALIFLIYACNPKTQEGTADNLAQRQALYDEVMAVHDEVMPHMQDIRQYKTQIREKIDSLARAGVTEGEETTALNNLINQLEDADEAMMDWMRSFGRDYTQMDDSTAIVYLEGEKEKVIQVKEDMEQSLQDAEAALQ